MHFFKAVLSLALMAGSVLAQGAVLTYPPPGSTLTVGSNFTVQVSMGVFIENADVVAIAFGLVSCPNGICSPPSSSMGDILYQGPYIPELPYDQYANYTVTVPPGFTPGTASLNFLNLYMVGLAYQPVVQYLNETVTVVASG